MRSKRASCCPSAPRPGTLYPLQLFGTDYIREVLRGRSTTRHGRTADAKKTDSHAGRKVNMFIDIQAKLAAGKEAGYERWAKIFNLKETAKTLNFLVENNLIDYDELAAWAE